MLLFWHIPIKLTCHHRPIFVKGCDRLTIAPQLLDKLSASPDPIEKKLDAAYAASMDIVKIDVDDEKTFRWMMNEDAMATEKLAEGIRDFTADIVKLEAIVKAKM